MFENRTIAVNGVERRYRLLVPENLPVDAPCPIVFGFHAYRGNVKAWLYQYSHLDQLAREKRFIIVYPEAPIRWSLVERDNPDVALFDALLADVSARYNIDRNRVYGTGMSNGAIFLHLLAALRGDVIAAIAPHSGKLNAVSKSSLARAVRPVPALIIHGETDRIIRVTEGQAARDFCKAHGIEAEYLELPGVGHVWGTAQGVEARIWAFFEKHPLTRATVTKASASPAGSEN